MLLVDEVEVWVEKGGFEAEAEAKAKSGVLNLNLNLNLSLSLNLNLTSASPRSGDRPLASALPASGPG